VGGSSSASSTCDNLECLNVDDVAVPVAVGSLPVVAARGARVGVVVAIAALVPAITDDEDVPKRQPVVAWEQEVACDSAAELAAATDSIPRRCDLAVAGDALYLHEHTTPGPSAPPSRLTRFDIATGAERWSREVGSSSTIDAHEEIVVISDKTHFEVYDAETGELRFEHSGSLADINRYGILLLTDGEVVTALDPRTGEVRWQADGALGTFCRDIVVVVAPAGDVSRTQPFAVLDHYSGEERWNSDEPFDPRTDEVTCGFGAYIYTTDGDTLREWDAYSGWINWTTPVAGAGAIEVYREVALVRSGEMAENIVAVERETGDLRWELPATEVGTAVSVIGRVREDADGVFTLLPLTGDIVNHISPTPGAPFEVVASSDTRVVVASGSIVTAYGMNDLGIAWQLDVGGAPDDFDVADGYLVTRTGSLLRGYR
jgi:outer membrane protein assembly factor BamB